MATRILLFALIFAGFSSCATYRSGQTPDDVYYSPQRETKSYVEVNRDEDNRLSYNETNLEDRRLRQQIRDQRFRSFDDSYCWNSPRYNSWGWNTWNNPYNTWGWNNYGWNNGWNHGYGWNTGWGWNNWNNGYVCIPGNNNVIILPGPGAPSNAKGIRYSPSVQRFANGGNTNWSNGKSGSGNSSRYFGNSNNNGGRRSGFFGGSSNNSSGNWNSGNSSSNRTFGNNSSSGGSSRTFSGGSSNSGSSNSGSKSGGAGGRRN
jgi:hypothetical protein